jgi:hypothetical protein
LEVEVYGRRHAFRRRIIAAPGSPRRRRGLAVIAATILWAASGGAALLAPLPVSAQESCFRDDAGKGANGTNWECRWTQLDTNWPDTTASGGYDPDCHAYCAFYISSQRYSYSDHVPMVAYGVDFEGDMRMAAADWSGQPYNSPWFGNCNCPSGGAFLTLGQKTSGTGGRACGIGWTTTAWQAQNITNDNHVVSSEADFATDFTGSWFDGPPPPTFGGQYCDAVNVAYHEVGHAFGEGHSSVLADIMYWGGDGADTRTIDADAQELLRTLYGAHTPNTPNIPIPCGPCRLPSAAASAVCSPPAPASVAECISYNYLAKAWDLAHADPVVDPTPIVQATPLGSGCLVSAVDYQAWVTCVLGWQGWK